MKKLQIYGLMLAFLLVWACGSKENQSEATEKGAEEIAEETSEAGENPMLANVTLTDDLVKKYMDVMPKLKEKGANMSVDSDLEGLYRYKQLENVVQEAGFKDFSEFVGTHTKIAYAIVSLEVGKNTNIDMDKIREEAAKEMEKAMNDPNLTAEQKEQMEAAQKLVDANLGAGKDIVKSTLDQFKKNLTENEREVVNKFKGDLTKLYENQ